MATTALAPAKISLDRWATPGEAKIARRLVDTALKAGYALSVCDGEEWTVKRSTDRAVILAALGTTDQDKINLRDEHGQAHGTFLLVYGNARDGSELIADHTDNGACNDIVAVVEGRATLAQPAWLGEA